MTTEELQAMAENFRQAELKPPDRDSKGRFAKNNSGGPGNPHARHCAMMLETLKSARASSTLDSTPPILN